jgi:hypothetical protein
MDKFKLESQFNQNNTIIRSQIDHIWAKVLENECKFGVTKAYSLDFHKFIYNAFKLPNALPMYNKKTITSSFL